MVKFTVKNGAGFDKQVRTAVGLRVSKVIANSESFLLETAEMLKDKFADSPEFEDLRTKLVGEFGFTPEEVSNLPRVLDLLVPNNSVTKLSIKFSSAKQEILLEWVDFAVLKDHQVAKHELTRLNRKTGNFEITDIISWVEWLEDGQTVRGYDFDGQQGGAFSRSGQGVMRRNNGGLWVYAPTKVFTKIAQSLKETDVVRGFGAVIRKSRLK